MEEQNKILTAIGFEGLCIPCIIGILPEERVITQYLYVDLRVQLDLTKFRASRRLEESLDYRLLSGIARELAQNNQYELIESFGFDLADACFARFPCTHLVLKIQKPGAIKEAKTTFFELQRGV